MIIGNHQRLISNLRSRKRGTRQQYCRSVGVLEKQRILSETHSIQIMGFVRNIVRRVSQKIFGEEKQEEISTVSRMNAYLNYVYRILLWEDPRMTWITLGLVHVLFWYVDFAIHHNTCYFYP